MQIQDHLPQFKGTKVMLLVCGTHAAYAYVARDADIEKVAEFVHEDLSYSDREGFFQTGGKGEVFGSGSVYEPNKQEVLQKFIQELLAHLKSIPDRDTFDAVYFYAPDYAAKIIEEKLPKEFSSKISERFHGNYTKQTPFDLLEMIKKAEEGSEKNLPNNPEARKILEKSKVARHVIKDKPEDKK